MLTHDMKLAFWKNNLGRQILYKSPESGLPILLKNGA